MEAYLDDPRFANYGRRATGIGQHAAAVRPIWEEAFRDRTREELIELVRSIGGDAVPILDYPALVSHPQVQALGAITEIEHPNAGRFATMAPVVRFSQTPTAIHSAPPTLGQHTDEVLRMAGLNQAEISALRISAIVS
jgi:formyl-CoA transferase